jgi:hypothetical protein
MLTWDDIQAKAVAFSKRWKAFKGIEKQHDQQFITELLACFGVDAGESGVFQEKAGTKWVDYLWPGMLGIEMKSPGESLTAAKTQLFNYLPKLQAEAVPQYLIVSDFVNMHLYRLATNDIHAFKTADLRKHIRGLPTLRATRRSASTTTRWRSTSTPQRRWQNSTTR